MKADLIKKIGWERYSRKSLRRLNNLHCCGYFSSEDTSEGLVLVTGFYGSLEEECFVKLFWLLDSSDSSIIDAKFQAYGDTALLVAAEESCVQVIGRKVVQTKLINEDKLELALRDYSNKPSLPTEKRYVFAYVVQAIQEAHQRSLALVESSIEDKDPQLLPNDFKEKAFDKQWPQYNKQQKLDMIELVLDEDVRPYVAMDGGGVDVLDISKDDEVTISYKGNCVTCFYASGATLNYIQQALVARLYPNIKVVPQF